ncbi:phage baseplate assembly protein V [Trabulsiella odontotermitis]|uniref:phage baseplate assembly protein V n=1 Tax=Trabulsiella odontotermitis TaxID=379893 RepID=UPI0006760945|nr:phage baseplate assembly protein V [Trabulsiella odontotermitis]KNC89858.1 baseplate assembly protein [Trabulsiella odontotermitis]
MDGEVLRLLANILRQGVVFDIDESAGEWSVRVQSGTLETGWMRWNTSRAGAFKIWIPPAIGEEVWIGCIGGNPETAFVLGSVYSNDNPAPGSTLKEMVITAPDGAKFRYDADASALEATGMKTAVIQASVSVTLDTPVTECTNHLKARTFELTEGGTMKGEITHSGGSLSSNGVVVHTHVHGGVEKGGSSTGGPQ